MSLINVFLFVFSFMLLSSQNVKTPNLLEKSSKIVVLGSSTAAGHGPSCSDSAWVNRYRKYLQSQNPKIEVVNLAVGGYTTYHILPDGMKSAKDRPAPSIGHNITKALQLAPSAIIINLPSNDCARHYKLNEQINNYKIVMTKADSAHIPVWVTTTQPCDYKDDVRGFLIAMRDSTYSIFGDRTIDFWTDIAENNGTIKKEFNSGDGVHLNDAAHRILFKRVVGKDALR